MNRIDRSKTATRQNTRTNELKMASAEETAPVTTAETSENEDLIDNDTATNKKRHLSDDEDEDDIPLKRLRTVEHEKGGAMDSTEPPQLELMKSNQSGDVEDKEEESKDEAFVPKSQDDCFKDDKSTNPEESEESSLSSESSQKVDSGTKEIEEADSRDKGDLPNSEKEDTVDSNEVKDEDDAHNEKKDASKATAVNNEDGQETRSERTRQELKGDGEDTNGLVPNGEDSMPNGHDDSSTVKSDDSEKENLGGDLPMDLTKKAASSDVITLSDESEPEEDRKKLMNGFVEMTTEEIRTRNKIVKQLQAELRNEEAKLVLLKKLRQSQVSHQLQDHSSSNNKQSSNRQAPGPPPLVRGNQQVQGAKVSAHTSQSQSIRNQHVSQPSSRTQMQGPPPLVMAPRMNSNSHLMQHSIRSGIMGGGMANLYPGFRPVHPQQPTPSIPAQEVQTPAQRQAAAKLALRKQLEKTLLQIPPPKPPPPEMNFIPSLACPDFIMLLGLEEVVNYIIDSQLIAKGEKNADEKFVCNPFSCVQCRSDYTPVWKREKPGSKNVICEQCVTSNQKKALKQEHTNRLKSAFVKALQQEQEIERMQSQSLAQTPPAPVSTSPMNLVTSSPLIPSASYKPSSEQLRHHQNFLQAQQAVQLRAGQPMGLQAFAPRGHFPYQMPFTKQTELQRQYLLDMIPRGSMSWKS